MPGKSEDKYRGWKIRITDKTVGTESSAMIEVWKPGHDPRSHTGVVVPFLKRFPPRARRPSRVDAQNAALEAAKKWIDQEVG